MIMHTHKHISNSVLSHEVYKQPKTVFIETFQFAPTTLPVLEDQAASFRILTSIEHVHWWRVPCSVPDSLVVLCAKCVQLIHDEHEVVTVRDDALGDEGLAQLGAMVTACSMCLCCQLSERCQDSRCAQLLRRAQPVVVEKGGVSMLMRRLCEVVHTRSVTQKNGVLTVSVQRERVHW